MLNDATMVGSDVADALGRILPNGKLPLSAHLTIAKGEPGTVRLIFRTSREDLPAKGQWTDAVKISASFVRLLVVQQKAATLHFSLQDGILSANGAKFKVA